MFSPQFLLHRLYLKIKKKKKYLSSSSNREEEKKLLFPVNHLSLLKCASFTIVWMQRQCWNNNDEYDCRVTFFFSLTRIHYNVSKTQFISYNRLRVCICYFSYFRINRFFMENRFKWFAFLHLNFIHFFRNSAIWRMNAKQQHQIKSWNGCLHTYTSCRFQCFLNPINLKIFVILNKSGIWS